VAVDQANRRVYVANSTSHTVLILDDKVPPTSSVVPVATTVHWKPERNPYFGEDGWRNVGYYQALWVDSLTGPGQPYGGAVTDTGNTPHWVPVYPDASGECSTDPDHTYILGKLPGQSVGSWSAPFNGPIKFWIYGYYYYYQWNSFGQMSITLKRN